MVFPITRSSIENSRRTKNKLKEDVPSFNATRVPEFHGMRVGMLVACRDSTLVP